jgi:hypothetical protein
LEGGRGFFDGRDMKADEGRPKGRTKLPNFARLPNWEGRGILSGKHEIMKYMKKAGGKMF